MVDEPERQWMVMGGGMGTGVKLSLSSQAASLEVAGRG